MELVGATALITGASGRIGTAIARGLHDRGASVVLHASTPERLSELAADMAAPVLGVDLALPEGPGLLAEKALGMSGRVDVVVHCAGIGHYGALGEMTPERLDRLLDVNLRAPLQLTRALLPGMLAAGRGHLVFVASIAGLVGVAHEAAYSATKAGMVGLADSLRLELARTGVGVSVVCPGAVDTDFFTRRGAPYQRRLPRMLPPGRVVRDVLRGIERDGERTVLPRWLGVAPAASALVPGLYRSLAFRFG
jgi:short-subunit dehydrogenase